MRYDGEELDLETRSDPFETVIDCACVVVETVEKASDGVRDQVLREYTTIDVTRSGEAQESPLAGETLRLTRTEGDEVEAEMVSGYEVDLLEVPEGFEPWLDHEVTGFVSMTMWLDLEAERGVMRQLVEEEYESELTWARPTT